MHWVDEPHHPGHGAFGRLGADEHGVAGAVGREHRVDHAGMVGIGHDEAGVGRVFHLLVGRLQVGKLDVGAQRAAFEVTEALQGHAVASNAHRG